MSQIGRHDSILECHAILKTPFHGALVRCLQQPAGKVPGKGNGTSQFILRKIEQLSRRRRGGKGTEDRTAPEPPADNEIARVH